MTKRITRPALKTGRKSEYKEKYNDMAYGFSLLGFADKRMAELFGVSEKTLNTWKQKHPIFLQSIYNGKEIADGKVAESLYKRAIGYDHPDVDIKMFEGQIIVTDIVKHYPPDTRAIQFWLNNRRRRRMGEEKPEDEGTWADRQEIDHTTKGEKIPAPQVYLPTDLPDSVVTTDQP